MQSARCVRMLAVPLIVGVVGSAGCAPSAPRVPTEEQKKGIAEDNQSFYKLSKAKTPQGTSPARPRTRGPSDR
jgi:hypothetical protein